MHPCQYWQCRKNKRGQLEVSIALIAFSTIFESSKSFFFQVDERGTMNAIFSRHKDCHLLIEESRATRQNTVEVE